ncbi:MAG: type IV pilus assembly protein PilM [Clostridia bacterium]|nr:type IV pilus assembly protein PilM [Clostridia bacterium]
MFRSRYLAVDIGNRNMKIVYGRVNKQLVEVIKYDIVDTPINSIKDGKIINANVIAGAISESIKRNRIKVRRLILNIAGTGIITRDIQIPKATDEEIEKMLEFEAPQYFPVDLESYVLDYKVIEEIVGAEGPNMRILLVAAPIRQVEEYMKLPVILKMDITAIDLAANSISKLLYSAASEKDEGAEELKEFAVVDIGAETTTVCIFSNSKLQFSRILLTGSSEIDKLIANSLNKDFMEAEKMKISLGRVITEATAGDERQEVLSISETISTAVSNIAGDINRFIDFYNSRSAKNRLQKIYICGGGTKLNGFKKYLSGYLNTPVEYLTPDGKVVYKGEKSPEEFKSDFILLINAIGAIIRG